MGTIEKDWARWKSIMSRDEWRNDIRKNFIKEHEISDAMRKRIQMSVGKTHMLILRMEAAEASYDEMRRALTYHYALIDDFRSHEIDIDSIKKECRMTELYNKYPLKKK